MPSIPPPSTSADLFPWASSSAQSGGEAATCWICGARFPVGVVILEGKVHDVNLLDQLLFEAGAFYIFDRGYLDFARLMDSWSLGLFCSRGQERLRVPASCFTAVDKSQRSAYSDQIIRLEGFTDRRTIRSPSSEVSYLDPESGGGAGAAPTVRVSARDIPDLYRCHWQFEAVLQMDQANTCASKPVGTTTMPSRLESRSPSLCMLRSHRRRGLDLQRSLYQRSSRS